MTSSDGRPARRGPRAGRLRVENALLAAVARALFRRPSTRPPARVLVYRTARLGDFVNALPALRLLRARLPRAWVGLATTATTRAGAGAVRASLSGAHDGLPWLRFAQPTLVDETFVFDGGALRAERARLAEWARAADPDALVLLAYARESFGSKLRKLLYLRSAGVRCPVYGWELGEAPAAAARRAPGAGARHQVVAAADSLRKVPGVGRVAVDDLRAELAPDAEADTWAEAWCGRHAAGGSLVLLFPGGTYAHKRWPVASFARLVHALAEDGHVVATVGGLADREAAAAVWTAVGRRGLDLSGVASLAQLGALARRACLFVGNDSGPVHVASAAGCPTVAILSAIEHPGIWEPWNHRRLAVRYDPPCSQCYSPTHCPTGTEACIREIPVAAVLARCRAALGAQAVAAA